MFNEFSLLRVNRQEEFKGLTVTFSIKHFMMAAYLYMIIPIAIYFLTWLRWYLGILVTAIAVVGVVFLFKDINKNITAKITLPVKHMIIALVVISVWAYSSSIFFYQTDDMHYRNALFRDMCDFDWPIHYPETGYVIAYYFTQWVIPALFGKAFGFTIANVALLAENIIGIYLVFLGICVVLRPMKNRDMWIILLMYLTFGGLNDIGQVIIDYRGTWAYGLGSGFGWPDLYNGYGYQFTPNDALIAWVFHETIVPWLAVVVFLAAPQLRYFAIIGLCVFPYGPFPFVGLVVFLLVGFFVSVKREGFWDSIKLCLSVQNICAMLSILPIFFLFYRANSVASKVGFYPVVDAFGPEHIGFLVIFYFLEFGLYGLIIHREYKGSPLFWSVIITLLVFPHFKIGNGRDFCMRATIPALFVLMLMMMCYLLNNCDKAPYSFATILLIGCVTLSCFGISKDWALRIKTVKQNGWRPYICDNIGTLSDKRMEDVPFFDNVVVVNPDDTTFYKYLAK